MIKLVLSDMDATLVPNSKPTASVRTRAAIDRLRAAGIEFGCATGRSIENTIMQFDREQRYVETGIYASGKQVLVRGKLVVDNPFPRDLLEELVPLFAALPNAMLVAFIRGMDPAHPDDVVPCSMGESGEKIQRFLDYYTAPGRNGNLWDNWQQLDGIPDVQIYMLGALTSNGQAGVPEMIGFFSERFPGITILNSAPGWCDVNQGVMNKAVPFSRFMDAMGYRADEVVFFADSENDIELMKLVPNSICVANAMPDAAAHARYTVPADVDDGPAQLMEALAETGGDLDAAISFLARTS